MPLSLSGPSPSAGPTTRRSTCTTSSPAGGDIYADYFTTTYADSELAARYSISIETGTAFGVGYISGRLVDGNGEGLAQVQIQVNAVPFNHDVNFPIVTSDAGGYSPSRRRPKSTTSISQAL